MVSAKFGWPSESQEGLMVLLFHRCHMSSTVDRRYGNKEMPVV